MDPFHSLHSVDVQKLQQLDKETRKRFLVMLDMMEEPDWRDSLTRLFSFLKLIDEDLAEHDEATLVPISSLRNLIQRMFSDSDVAGNAFKYLEHHRQVVDMIALEQLMIPASPKDPTISQ
jgi:hypothetical protein